ncbi:MAG: AI-2E family transporter [Clostridia bacterium]|nr:AI-2E family transporter [Clostridia bacterium]
MKRLLNDEKRGLIISVALMVFGAVLFFMLLYKLSAVRAFVGSVLRAAAPVATGFALAFVLNIPMSFIERKLPQTLKVKKPAAARWIALAAVLAIVMGIAAAVVTLIVPRIIESVEGLLSETSGYAENVKAFLNEVMDKISVSQGTAEVIKDALDGVFERLRGAWNDMAPMLPDMTYGIVTAIYSVVVTLVICIHSLANKEGLKGFLHRFLTAALPKKHIEGVFDGVGTAKSVFRKYFVAQLTSSAVIAALSYVGMRVLSIPNPEFIALFVSFGALIPIVGPWISIGVSAIIVLMSGGSALAFRFLIMILVIQLVEDNLIYPKLIGSAIGMTGLEVLAAVIIAGGLFGIPGLLIAVPTAAVVRKLFKAWVNRRNIRRAEKAETA